MFFSRDARNGARADGNVQATRTGFSRCRQPWGRRRNAKTGNPVPAMHYIGDTDMKTVNRYLKRRDDRLREVADTWTTG
jgi:hypothetical protein